MIKIATWNINSIRLRINLLKQFIEEHSPDIITLQETKVVNEKFPIEAIESLGYKVFFSGQKSYNGVAILSKLFPQNHFSLDIYNDDKRHIAINIDDLEIHNFYVPAGGDIPDPAINPKFHHKLEFLRLAQEWFEQNRSLDHKIILTGDLNIAPYEHDVWSSKQLSDVVSHTDIERQTLLSFKDALSFTDAARLLTPMNQKLYTWWSYRNRDWKKSNRGRRLDHIWTSKNLEQNIKNIEVLNEMRNLEKPSDHVPFIVQIKL